MKKTLVLATLFVGAFANAQVILQYNFNSATPDANTGTGTTNPNINLVASQSIALIGGTTSTFASGVGSTDTAASDNSGYNTTTYPAASANNKSAGVRVLFSTAGFRNIKVSYDWRTSNTSARDQVLQYTLNGSTWIDAVSFVSAGGDTWNNNRSFDFSAITAANNNANFGIRMVSSFAPGGTSYRASSTTGTYASNGTWRFDMVTVNAEPVPEPATLMALGLGAAAFVRKRRSK